MSGYYRRLAPLHTGHLQDYLIWFVAVAAVVLVVLGVLR
jgi:nicotinamide mononucleotide adenylyltransferase